MNTDIDAEHFSPHISIFEWVNSLDELCEHLLEYARDQHSATPNLPRVTDYPKIIPFGTGLPYFGVESDRKSPIEWENVFSNGVMILSGPLEKVPNRYMERFSSFLECFNKAFPLELDETMEGRRSSLSEYRAKEMAQLVTCEYLYKYGPTDYDHDRMMSAASRYISRWYDGTLRVSLVVPICQTKFDFDHFCLGEGNYICRMSEAIQLSRSCIRSIGTGVEKTAADAATHAFVSSDWFIQDKPRDEMLPTLHSFGNKLTDVVDQFFAGLRLATGIDTGYGQLFYMPRRWAHSPKWGLPETQGRYVRRYPPRFDEHGWVRPDLPVVSKSQMAGVREAFRLVKNINEKKLTIAIRRLNSALTRDDDDDAILDAIIGLEILLLDKDPQALSYKLRMRAAALSRVLKSDWLPSDVHKAADTLYKIRSKIVHQGKTTSAPRSISVSTAFDTPSADRELAIRLLRFVLDALLKNPKYLDPLKIDQAILKFEDSPGDKPS